MRRLRETATVLKMMYGHAGVLPTFPFALESLSPRCCYRPFLLAWRLGHSWLFLCVLGVQGLWAHRLVVRS